MFWKKNISGSSTNISRQSVRGEQKMNSGSEGVSPLHVLINVEIMGLLKDLCQKTGNSKRMIVEDALRQYLER